MLFGGGLLLWDYDTLGIYSSPSPPFLSEPSADDYVEPIDEILVAQDIEVGPDVTKTHLVWIFSMYIGIFVVAMDGTIVASAYPAIGSEMAQLENASWIATAYILSTASFQLLYGKLSGIFGGKSCLLSAYTIFALGSLLSGLSNNMPLLIASRAFAGIGGGGIQTLTNIITTEVAPLEHRGTLQGISDIVWTIGSVSGAPLGGIFADGIGWRWAFFCQVPLSVIAILSVAFFLRLPRTMQSAPASNSHSKPGFVPLVFFSLFLLSTFDWGIDSPWLHSLTLATLAFSLFFFGFFWWIELCWASGTTMRILFNQPLLATYMANYFSIAMLQSVIFHASLWLQAVQRRTAADTGTCLIPNLVGGLVGSLGSGLMFQWTGRNRRSMVGAYVLQFFGAILVYLSTSELGNTMEFLELGLTLVGIGSGAGFTSSVILLAASTGQTDQAIATGVSYFFRSLGAVIGISAGSTIVQETLRSYLKSHLSGHDIDQIITRVRESLGYIDKLEPVVQDIVKNGYTRAVRYTFIFNIGLSACAVVSAMFTREMALTTE